MNRRRLLVSGLLAGPALVLGWGLLPPRERVGRADALTLLPGRVALNGWLRIGPGDDITLVMPHAEMGQGVHTALAMIVAEELRVPPQRLRFERPGSDSRYGNVWASVEAMHWFAPEDTEPGAETTTVRTARWLLGKTVRELGVIATGGSSAVADLYEVLREAGARARAQLLGAASLQWKLPVAELQLDDGVIRHASGPSARFAELAAAAAATPPGEFQPTPPEAWRVLGTVVPRLDGPAKLSGQARYGIDAREEGQLFAAIAHGPVLGSEPGPVDSDALLRRPGLLRLVRLPALAGAAPALAVVARGSWPALQAARLLSEDRSLWQGPPGLPPDTGRIRRQLDEAAERAADGHEGFVFRDRGKPDKVLGEGSGWIEARYRAPYLAHATMEPMNCTVRVAQGRVTLWAPTQVPTFARAVAARVAGVPESAVDLHVPYLGGGFGRRLEVDFIAQAVRVALECGGAPVQLLWSREQDTRHDFYRPAAAAVLRAVPDAKGRPRAVVVGSAGDAIMPRYYERVFPLIAGPVDLPDKTAAEGLFGWPYLTPGLRVQHVATRSGVPIGSWRSVGHSHNAFFAESFIDELAAAARTDPVAYRLSLLDRLPRHAAVLRRAAEAAGWGQALPAGRARGVALHDSFGSIVALVAEVSRSAGRLRVHRLVAAVDCGLVMHPRLAAQQVESALVFGLSAALQGRIDIDEGVVRQGGFDDLRVLRLAATPAIEVHFVPSRRPPAGLGEPGTPPVAPALANAWFALSGERLRELPLMP